jgi:hypothetical protein
MFLLLNWFVFLKRKSPNHSVSLPAKIPYSDPDENGEHKLHSLEEFLFWDPKTYSLPIQVAARSEAWVCDPRFLRLGGSNPTGDMHVFL